MKTIYTPKGTCSRKIEVETDGEMITAVRFEGGCSGNAQGIASLVAGMKIDDVIERLGGLTCEHRKTSCPDQLAQALLEMKQKNQE